MLRILSLISLSPFAALMLSRLLFTTRTFFSLLARLYEDRFWTHGQSQLMDLDFHGLEK